jgi:ComF family protein
MVDLAPPVLTSVTAALWTALDGLGSVVFPSSCLVCRSALAHPLRGPLCRDCHLRLPRIAPPYCPRCGLPYESGVAPGLCGPCRRFPRHFRRARAQSPYADAVRLCLHALKFRGRRRLASLLGREAARRWVLSGDLLGAAAVVPVPLSRKRRRERGYNQAALIARAVARESGIPIRVRILEKIRERPPQAGLSREARRKNVVGVYRANLPASLRGEALLLVDDVLTTGATADSAACALLAAGAGAVDVLTLARVV